MSSSCASTSAVSTRRSTFRPEKAATTWRMTRGRLSGFWPSSTFRSRQGPAFGSKHCSNLVETGVRTQLADYDSVASSFSSTRKLAADHEPVAIVEESVSREKRDRDLNVVQTLKDRQISISSWNGKLNQPFEEKSQLRNDQPKHKQKWRSEIGKREILILRF